MYKDMSKRLAIIPARGGSKRLPRKNLRELAGKPMIAYSIEEALKSELFHEVYVATEDPEIAEVARGYGAIVPYLLPEDLTEDAVSSLEPCLHLTSYFEDSGRQYSVLFCVQPTSPLRLAKDFQQSFQIFQETQSDFLVSTIPIDPHYFHWALKEGQKHGWEMYFGQKFLEERIHLPPVYRPNGAIKIGFIHALRKLRHFFGRNLAVYQMPEERSIHVATEFDFQLAAMLLGRRGGGCLETKGRFSGVSG